MWENRDYEYQLQRDMQTVFARIDRLQEVAKQIGGRIDSVWNFLDSKWREAEIERTAFALTGDKLPDDEPDAIQALFAKRALFQEESSVQQVVALLESVLGGQSFAMPDRDHLPNGLESVLGGQSFAMPDRDHLPNGLESIRQLPSVYNYNQTVDSSPERTQSNAFFTEFNRSDQERDVDKTRFRPIISDMESVWIGQTNHRFGYERGENSQAQILAGQDSIKAIIEKHNRNVIELLQQATATIKELVREESDFTLEIG